MNAADAYAFIQAGCSDDEVATWAAMTAEPEQARQARWQALGWCRAIRADLAFGKAA